MDAIQIFGIAMMVLCVVILAGGVIYLKDRVLKD
jgi:hypothetical protein